MSTTRRAGYDQIVTWTQFDSLVRSWMKMPNFGRSRTNVTISNPIINISKNMASLVYDQVLGAEKSDTIPNYVSKEQRTLVKENGKWKIASLSTTNIGSYKSTWPQLVEEEINDLGYNFLNAKEIDEALQIFKFNVEMYPNSWNPYDSLGEAYAAAGNKSLAILNYEKSIKLNPKNDSGKKILAQLKKEAAEATTTAQKSSN